MRHLRFIVGLGLLLVCPRVSVAAEARWVEVRSPHFSVITDDGEKRGRDVLLRFEQMRTAFGVVFQRVNVNISVPLQIIAFRSSKELKQYAPLYDGKPITLAGYFQGGEDRNFIALDLSGENNWGTVFHEYAHLLINGNLPPTPLWFDEGFAEYCSSLKIDKKEIDIGLVRDDLPYTLSQNRWLKLVELFSVGHDSKIYNRDDRRSVFYAQSWITVHYLMSKRLMKQASLYNDLVMNQHKPVAEAIRSAFAMEPEKLEKDINNYYSGNHLVYFSTVAPPGSDNLQFTSRAMEPIELKVLFADFDYHMRDYRERGLAGFREIVNVQPDNPAANRGLGYAALERGDYDHAGEYFHRAAAQDSKDPRVHYLSAMLMSRQSGDSAKEAEAIKKELAAAIALDPNYADAYSLLGLTYLRVGEEELAEDAIKKAIALSPRNGMYISNLANLYLREDKVEEAIPLLRQLQESGDTRVAGVAERQLEQIEQQKSAAAAQKALEAKQEREGEARLQEIKEVEALARQKESQRPDEEPVPKPEKGPVLFMKGRLVSVDCSPAPSAVLMIVGNGKTWKMLAPQAKNLVVMGNADKLSCSWSNQKVAINYRKTGEREGKLVSLELQ